MPHSTNEHTGQIDETVSMPQVTITLYIQGHTETMLKVLLKVSKLKKILIFLLEQ